VVPGDIGHDQVLDVANAAAANVAKLLRGFLEDYR
jgi:hypothetical protein